jgi:hypothetical protein
MRIDLHLRRESTHIEKEKRQSVQDPGTYRKGSPLRVICPVLGFRDHGRIIVRLHVERGELK